MHIVTIYTLYNRRAGAELCFEKTVEAISAQFSEVNWTIFCNKQAETLLKEKFPYVNAIYNNNLDSQYKKAFWLEFQAPSIVNNLHADCFWIPSGCNHFPGKWKIPTLTTFHDLGEYHVINKYGFARTVFRKFICIPRSVKRSSAFTAVSDFTLKDMKQILSIKKCAKVVYNGKSPHKIIFVQNSQELIKKEQLNPQSYIFVPGRTDYIGKGLDVLLKSYARILTNYPEIKLVLVGPEGEGHPLLIKEIEKNNWLGKRVFYLGRVGNEELAALFENCLMTVIASRFEGFGFPVLEAIEYNVPIVCSDGGALPEIAGKGALIFKSGDDMDLHEKILKLVNDSELRNELLKNGKLELNRFSWEKCAEEMMDMFNSIIN